MGQVLIRNLDDALIADFKQVAASNGRSLEAELREALRRAAPKARLDRRSIAMDVRNLLPSQVPGPEGTEIIRWYRDTNGGRDVDAF